MKKIWFSSIYFSAKHLQKRKSWRSKAETVLMWMYSVHAAYFITLSFSGVLDFSKFGKRVILSKSQLNRNITFSYLKMTTKNNIKPIYNLRKSRFKKILETATLLWPRQYTWFDCTNKVVFPILWNLSSLRYSNPLNKMNNLQRTETRDGETVYGILSTYFLSTYRTFSLSYSPQSTMIGIFTYYRYEIFQKIKRFSFWNSEQLLLAVKSK